MNKNWKNYRIKDIAKVSRGASPRPIQDYLTNNEIDGIPWIKISDATKVKKYIESTEQYIILSGVGKSNLVLPGDLIVSNSATPGIPRFLKIKACIHDGWLLLRKFKNVNKEFLFYLIESIRLQLKNQGTGSIFINLSIDILANQIVSIPSLDVQNKIVSYLDTETSKIDRKISILEQKYEKLEEYKQSVIFEAVTKGLDASVPMKNSGVDWIGEIPNGWITKRIKDITVNLGGGNYGEDEGNEGIILPCISISDFKNGDLSHTLNIKMNRVYKKKNILKKGSILIEKSGGGEKVPVGRTIYLLNDLESYYTNFVQGIKIIESVPKFINYCFQVIHKNRLHMNYIKQTTGLQNFEFNKFSNYFQIPVPSIEIQNEIVTFLDNFTTKIDKKKEIIKKQIELLKEYKQTIIYESVTGKIEIL